MEIHRYACDEEHGRQHQADGEVGCPQQHRQEGGVKEVDVFLLLLTVWADTCYGSAQGLLCNVDPATNYPHYEGSLLHSIQKVYTYRYTYIRICACVVFLYGYIYAEKEGMENKEDEDHEISGTRRQLRTHASSCLEQRRRRVLYHILHVMTFIHLRKKELQTTRWTNRQTNEYVRHLSRSPLFKLHLATVSVFLYVCNYPLGEKKTWLVIFPVQQGMRSVCCIPGPS